jgi:outer membrane protein assembly factor BamD (BamD/ComL family)
LAFYSLIGRSQKLAKYILFIVFLVLASCSSNSIKKLEKAEYIEARQKNDVSIYDKYIKMYPYGSYYDIAIYYRDKAALDLAKKIGTPEAFKEFLEKYPSSVWSDQAKYFMRYGVL